MLAIAGIDEPQPGKVVGRVSVIIDRESNVASQAVTLWQSGRKGAEDQVVSQEVKIAHHKHVVVFTEPFVFEVFPDSQHLNRSSKGVVRIEAALQVGGNNSGIAIGARNVDDDCCGCPGHVICSGRGNDAFTGISTDREPGHNDDPASCIESCYGSKNKRIPQIDSKPAQGAVEVIAGNFLKG